MDYYKIGQRIRKYRKVNNLSQEALAEKIGISTTHMSHIETGNTKLSLAVLVNLSLALGVSTDDLLFSQSPDSKSSLMDKTIEILESCNSQELAIIIDIIKATKISLSKICKLKYRGVCWLYIKKIYKLLLLTSAKWQRSKF